MSKMWKKELSKESYEIRGYYVERKKNIKNITEYRINNKFNTTKKVNLPLTNFKKLSNDYKINKEVVVC